MSSEFQAHLFDADMKGVYAFSESKQLTCGTAATTFTVDGIKFGLGICFDIFFDEYSRALRNLGNLQAKIKIFEECTD